MQSHNRTVVTFVAPVESAVDAAFAGIRVARDSIDLTMHSGAHPRMGAADVVPFIPLEGTTMEQCVALARTLGERAGGELGIPVFLYERAATSPARENLADIRRGEFEKIRGELGTSPVRTPDFGPSKIHPTAGTVAIGARPFLVAYNVYLGDASNLGVAKEVAKAVRGSSGGLKNVKAMGLEVDGQAQVSMNLVDIEKTPMFRAYDMVKMEAAAHGVSPTWSELVGLVPERAHLRIRGAPPPAPQLFHRAAARAQGARGRERRHQPERLPRLGCVIESRAGRRQRRGARGLARPPRSRRWSRDSRSAARSTRTSSRPSRTSPSKPHRSANASRSSSISTRSRTTQSPPHTSFRRRRPSRRRCAKAAITAALIGASEVPLETARACATVAALAEIAASKGNSNARSDAGVAALMAEAGCRGAAFNVKVNVDALADSAAAHGLTEAAENFVRDASDAAKRTAALVLGG